MKALLALGDEGLGRVRKLLDAAAAGKHAKALHSLAAVRAARCLNPCR
jgi:hypothetical protein